MTEVLSDELSVILQRANNARERLLFAIGPSGAGKTRWLRATAEAFGLHFLSVGAPLGRHLQDLPARSRPLEVDRLVTTLIPAGCAGLCVDNTEVLFAPELKCDPLRLAAALSRHRLVVFVLAGEFRSGRFVHADPAHPEYKSTEIAGTTVVTFAAGTPIYQQT